MIDVIVAGPDDPELRRLAQWCGQQGHQVSMADDQDGVRALLADEDAQIVFARSDLKPGGVIDLLKHLDALGDPPPVVTLADLSESRQTAEDVSAGAYDFLPLPFDPAECAGILERVLRPRERETHEGFVKYEAEGAFLRVLLPQDVEHDDAMEVIRFLESGMAMPTGGILVDFSHSRHICSAMVSALFLLDKQCKQAGIPVVLAGIGERVRRVLDLAGVAAVFETAVDLAAGRSALESRNS